jgi:hypothetical protein
VWLQKADCHHHPFWILHLWRIQRCSFWRLVYHRVFYVYFEIKSMYDSSNVLKIMHQTSSQNFLDLAFFLETFWSAKIIRSYNHLGLTFAPMKSGHYYQF